MDRSGTRAVDRTLTLLHHFAERGGAPAEFREIVARDLAYWLNLVKVTGVKPEQ